MGFWRSVNLVVESVLRHSWTREECRHFLQPNLQRNRNLLSMAERAFDVYNVNQMSFIRSKGQP
jgi:hypothetical protein